MLYVEFLQNLLMRIELIGNFRPINDDLTEVHGFAFHILCARVLFRYAQAHSHNKLSHDINLGHSLSLGKQD